MKFDPKQILHWPNPGRVNGVPNLSTAANLTLSAINESVVFILQVPRAGTISKVYWGTRVFTTNGTIDTRIETVDNSTGLNTGTLWATNTKGNANPLSTGGGAANQLQTATLTAGAVVAQGDMIAIVIKQPGSSPGNFGVAVWNDELNANFPICVDKAGAAVASLNPSVALEYSDGVIPAIPAVWPVINVVTTNFNNSSTPDEIGNYFRLPCAARVQGIWCMVNPAATSRDFNLNLYDVDGFTKLATYAADASFLTLAVGGYHTYLFTAPVYLAPGQYYRVVVEPATASNISVYELVAGSAAIAAALPGGSDWCKTSAKNPSSEASWTQDTTRMASVGLLIDQLEAFIL